MGYPGNEDLTPGDFRGGMKPMVVRTDSLASFGTGFAANAEGFGGLAKARIAEIRGGANSCADNRAIGRSDVLHEIRAAGLRTEAAGMTAETLSTDLTVGNVALGHAAAWMAQKYASTDGINAAMVGDAFQPPANAKPTTANYLAKAATNRTAATGSEPLGDPYHTRPAETDYDPSYVFVPPADPDQSTLAPSEGYGSGGESGPVT